MNKKTPLSSSSPSSSLPLFNCRQNQPVTYTPNYLQNEFTMQQIPNNRTNFYHNSAYINDQYLNNNFNEHCNNYGRNMRTVNIPQVNSSMVPLTETLNYNLYNNSDLEHSLSSSYYSYNDTHIPQLPNVNEYFSDGSLPNTPNKNFTSEYTQSLSNNICYNTPTMPLHVNSLPTEIDISPDNCFNNKYDVLKKENKINKKLDNVDEWFATTCAFLNDINQKPLPSTHTDSTSSSNQFSSPYLKHRSYSKIKNRRKEINEKRSAKIKEIKRLSSLTIKQLIAYEKKKRYQLSPTNVYRKNKENAKIKLVFGERSALNTCSEFVQVFGKRTFKPTYNVSRKSNVTVKKRTVYGNHSSSLYYSYKNLPSCNGDFDKYNEKSILKELNKKIAHPDRLHPDLWHNELGEMNVGPLCRCSIKSQRSGIRHNFYVGEGPFKPCLPYSNNADKLFHYRIIITPPTNFVFECPTIIEKDGKKFAFEGFSLLSHYLIPTLPACKFIRFNTCYTILYIEDEIPENFVVSELQLFYDYLFKDILELIDLDLHAFGNKDGCPQFHFIPRFVRELSSCKKEILPMNDVLKYLLMNNKLLFEENSLAAIKNMSMDEWQNIADESKGMIVTNRSTRPHSIRVDQLDRDNLNETTEQIENDGYPVLVHFGIRPLQLSYTGNSEYQKGWRDYVKYKHLLINMLKPSHEDKNKLIEKEEVLQEMRFKSKMKRGLIAAVSCKGFYKTGLMCDIVQHAMVLPVLVCHLRFHKSLDYLEDTLNYKFKNRYLLQLALTHPSYRENFGTNPDHARNTLTNCGIRQPEYGNRHIHCENSRKRGINTLINIMSQFGNKNESESKIMHNERLEFLGDAVIEFVTTIHLFHIFPDIEEGGLATYRSAIVQNQHLALLAKSLKLDDYMLYTHGSDLCHNCEFNHAMANCFEALVGALFLDGGIDVADRVFSEILFSDSTDLLDIWVNYPKHPLQQYNPDGDRMWIKTNPFLKKLTEFEDSTGIKFKHIRLLARAFTDRSVGFTNLTLGSNQRLEFLGDTVLQLVVSEYLYKFYPEHHEGHLSLLRSSLVNNKTQSIVCDDLGMTNYVFNANPMSDLKTKAKADLVEAFLGALYIDKGLRHCEQFCSVCFFPRLQDFIVKQDWNDSKSKLQQCCLTLRSVNGGEPDIPVYKVIGSKGPTNNRTYEVVVYFKGVRLAQASGHSIQQAEMNAANNALQVTNDLFPQLNHQRRVISRNVQKQCKDGQTNIEDIIKLEVESNTLQNESDEVRKKLHKELLAALCVNKKTAKISVDGDDNVDNTKSEKIQKKSKKYVE